MKMKKEFHTEIWFRCGSAIDCLDAFEYIKEDQKIPALTRGVIKYALTRIAITQLTSILDETSKYSLRIDLSQPNKLTTSESRLRKFFDEIKTDELNLIKKELDLLLNKNKGLIKKMFHMRNTRIAHAGRPSFMRHELDIKILYFPTVRIVKFADNLQGIFNRTLLSHRSN